MVLYHHNCPKCHQAIPRYEQIATTSQQLRVALVAVPSHGDQSLAPVSPDSPCRLGALEPDKQWFVTTPAAIYLEDGVVVPEAAVGVPEPLARRRVQCRSAGGGVTVLARRGGADVLLFFSPGGCCQQTLDLRSYFSRKEVSMVLSLRKSWDWFLSLSLVLLGLAALKVYRMVAPPVMAQEEGGPIATGSYMIPAAKPAATA